MTVQTLSVSRTRAGRAPRDRSVVLVLIVMMGLVFGPIIGVHAFAAMASSPAPAAIEGAAR